MIYLLNLEQVFFQMAHKLIIPHASFVFSPSNQ